MDAMGASVCNCRVIKSCMDPISSVWRAGIAVEMPFIHPNYHLDWDSWSLRKNEISQESQPTFRGLRCCKWMPWGASVCNCRVIKSCMDHISSVWRAGIAVEMPFIHPNYHLDWDLWSLRNEISQESQPTFRFALLYMDAMGASVCNCRVIKSCMDPISSVWRAGIAVEMPFIHPNYHLDWDSWSLRIEISQESQPTFRFALL